MRFSRAELEAAHDRYVARSDHCAASGDWRPYGDQFTEDARYVEHFLGTFEGREAITEWITAAMATYPEMRFPQEWRMFDEERGQVLFAAWNELPDIDGNGPYRVISWSLIDYAGNDQWSRQEDLYEAQTMVDMTLRWSAARDASERP
jgi:SnoaL-like domain